MRKPAILLLLCCLLPFRLYDGVDLDEQALSALLPPAVVPASPPAPR